MLALILVLASCSFVRDPDHFSNGSAATEFDAIGGQAGNAPVGVAGTMSPDAGKGQGACGNVGQDCCTTGEQCFGGSLFCVQGQCAPCGGTNQWCCPTGAACAVPGQSCQGLTCQVCGVAGTHCCAGQCSQPGFVCKDDLCVSCGKPGEACCDEGAAEMSCDHETNKATCCTAGGPVDGCSNGAPVTGICKKCCIKCGNGNWYGVDAPPGQCLEQANAEGTCNGKSGIANHRWEQSTCGS